VLLDPVELGLPPLNVREPALSVKAFNAGGDGCRDSADDFRTGWYLARVTEDGDPPCLLGRIGSVGADVQPEEERAAEIVEPRSRRCVVEVDHRDRRARAEDEVAWGEVVVADDLTGAGERGTGCRGRRTVFPTRTTPLVTRPPLRGASPTR
jgi:hypothetical protein